MGERSASVLVLGGARSGKSETAERLITDLAGPASVTYVATARLEGSTEPGGEGSLSERVERHRARRPPHWRTVEAGDDLAGVVETTHGPLIVDSLGPWVAACHPEVPDVGHLVRAIAARPDPTVLVSDEVGLAVHPMTPAGRWFVDALGTVNQAVAAACTDVWLVVAGRVLPLPTAPPPLSPGSGQR